VEGALSGDANCQYDCFHILQHVCCGDAKDFISGIPHGRIPGNITFWTIASIMRLAINLNYELGSAAIEISDIWTNRMLPPELHTLLASPQLLPQQNLGQAHFAAKFAGVVYDRALQRLRAPSTTLRAVPLPVPGRILVALHHAAHPFFSIHA
jgi:hypothetical protein